MTRIAAASGQGGMMSQFRYSAMVVLDAEGADGHALRSGTHKLMVHAWRKDRPTTERFFPAEITWEGADALHTGEHKLVTIRICDAEAPPYFAPGREFALWGDGSGHGIVCRRVFTDFRPC
jgi:hypothetical protein